MQLLALIASFVFGRMNNPPHHGLREIARELFQDTVLKSRKPVILILTGLSAVMFFCGGFFITILEATSQYDRVGYVTLTSTMGAGIILFCVAALGFAYVFAYAWPGATRHQVKEAVQPKQEHHVSTLEQALSTLVMDFVKERETRRQQHATNPVPPTGRAADSTVHSEPSAPLH